MKIHAHLFICRFILGLALGPGLCSAQSEPNHVRLADRYLSEFMQPSTPDSRADELGRALNALDIYGIYRFAVVLEKSEEEIMAYDPELLDLVMEKMFSRMKLETREVLMDRMKELIEEPPSQFNSATRNEAVPLQISSGLIGIARLAGFADVAPEKKKEWFAYLINEDQKWTLTKNLPSYRLELVARSLGYLVAQMVDSLSPEDRRISLATLFDKIEARTKDRVLAAYEARRPASAVAAGPLNQE